MGPVEITTGLRVGQEVEAGRVIGSPARGPGPGGCNTIPQPPGAVRLHWELWSGPQFGVSPAGDLKCEWLPRGLDHGPALVAQNAIYALKRGDIGSCVTAIPGDA